MSKPKPYSRQKLRDLRRDWARDNLRLFLMLTLGMVALLAVITVGLVVFADGRAFYWYLLGALHAAFIALYLAMLNAVILASDGSAIRHLRGAWGEENTRSELAIAKRRRTVWGWVDSISLRAATLITSS